MAAKWGVFLCNCQQTLVVNPQQLLLPPCTVQLASHPDTDLQAFAAGVARERFDRVLIGCCAAPALFEETLSAAGFDPARIHFVNLKEGCFQVHSAAAAHSKATRMVRAAFEAAQTQGQAAYNPLTAGERLLIVTDGLAGLRLAPLLQDEMRLSFVLTAEVADFTPLPAWRVYRGRRVRLRGRLGDFHATVALDNKSDPQELQADQVVVITAAALSGVQSRTGCHLLVNPGTVDLEQVAERIRGLTGHFLKTIHVSYRSEVCAGGTANHEACGVCIAACPYEAIQRQHTNPLRLEVDQLACEGCGACVSACPTSALHFTEPSSSQLYTRLAALLAPVSGDTEQERQVVVFHCGEHGRRVLDEAAHRGLSYPARVLAVEVPCLRYVSEATMLAAFRLGAAGVGLLGCTACQHGERELLYQKTDFCRLLLEVFNLGAGRLRLITTAEGIEESTIDELSRFAEAIEATPLRATGQPLRQSGNRQVITEAIATFIEQLGHEPGRQGLEASQPFAMAEVQADGCTLCRSCVNVCPVHAFRLVETTSSLQFNHLACVACGLCATVCPENVITLQREVVLNRQALGYHTVVQDAMVGCLRCGKPFVNRKALETIMSKMQALASLGDTFSGERRQLLRMCPECRAVAAMLEVEKGWEP